MKCLQQTIFPELSDVMSTQNIARRGEARDANHEEEFDQNSSMNLDEVVMAKKQSIPKNIWMKWNPRVPNGTIHAS